jgi:hypothetical protein
MGVGFGWGVGFSTLYLIWLGMYVTKNVTQYLGKSLIQIMSGPKHGKVNKNCIYQFEGQVVACPSYITKKKN